MRNHHQQELDENNMNLWKEWIVSYHKVLLVNQEIFKEKDDDFIDFEKKRLESMNCRVNPQDILRNYQMQEAIEQAEKNDDFSLVKELL